MSGFITVPCNLTQNVEVDKGIVNAIKVCKRDLGNFTTGFYVCVSKLTRY